jgi:hypothetical protein
MIKRKETKSVQVTTYLLDAVDLIRALVAHGTLPTQTKIEETRVYFQVPGGADWSGMDIDISKENPLIVEHKRMGSR